MYCQNCGKQIPDNADFCPECGTSQKLPSSAAGQAANAGESSSGKGAAIASLVLGIVALVCAFSSIGAIVGIILGIIGWILGRGAKKRLPKDETGMATAGIVCSIIAVIVCIFPLLFLGGALTFLSM